MEAWGTHPGQFWVLSVESEFCPLDICTGSRTRDLSLLINSEVPCAPFIVWKMVALFVRDLLWKSWPKSISWINSEKYLVDGCAPFIVCKMVAWFAVHLEVFGTRIDKTNSTRTVLPWGPHVHHYFHGTDERSLALCTIFQLGSSSQTFSCINGGFSSSHPEQPN